MDKLLTLTNEQIVPLEPVPLRDMIAKNSLLAELETLGIESSLDVWVLAVGEYITTDFAFPKLLKAVCNELDGLWNTNHRIRVDIRIKVDTNLRVGDPMLSPNTCEESDTGMMCLSSLLLRLSISLSSGHSITWDVTLRDCCLQLIEHWDMEYDRDKICSYLEDKARNITVRHWATPTLNSLYELPRKRPHDLVAGLLDSLQEATSPRDLDVFQERFGLLTGEKKTLEEIGQRFPITRERVRQVINRCWRVLRHRSRKRYLRPFVIYLNSLFRQHGGIMTLEEIAASSDIIHGLRMMWPRSYWAIMEFLLYQGGAFSALDYDYLMGKTNVVDAYNVTWYLNEINPNDIRKARDTAIQIIQDNPHRYDFNELCDVTAMKSKLAKTFVSSCIRTCSQLEHSSTNLMLMKGRFTKKSLTLSQMAIVALKELMVPSHSSVVVTKMKEIFPDEHIAQRSAHNMLRGQQFERISRDVYGLAEWSITRSLLNKNQS